MRTQQEACQGTARQWAPARVRKIGPTTFPRAGSRHSLNFTTHRLHDVLEGDPAEILDQVIAFYNAEKLKEATTVN